MTKGIRLLGTVIVQAPLVSFVTCVTTAIAVASTTKFDALLLPAADVTVPRWWNWVFPWILEVSFLSGALGLIAALALTTLAIRRPVAWVTGRPIVFAWCLVFLSALLLIVTGILVAASTLRGAGV
jgi:hypothetical protein